MSEFLVSPIASASFDGLRFPKIGREDITLVSIEAELCPHAMKQVLDIVTSRGVLPFTTSFRCGDRIQLIEIELATLPYKSMLALLQIIRRIRNVRRAEIAVSTKPPAPLPIVAKL